MSLPEGAAIERWILNDFFRLGLDLSGENMIAHRKRITAERSNLPHVAGKALALSWYAIAAISVSRVLAAKVPAGTKRRGKTSVQVKSIVRPEPDAEKLARAFLMLAEHLAKEKPGEASEDQAPRSRP